MRKLARESCFKMIFENLFRNETEFNEECFNVLAEDDKIEGEDAVFVRELFDAYLEHKTELMQKVEPFLTGYELDRAYKVDLALILLALAEIQFIKTQANIVVNEVINIAKKYSTDNSPKFINGVLGAILKA